MVSLRYGMRSGDVANLQAMLYAVSYYQQCPGFNPGEMDGSFGPKTLVAVSNFQGAMSFTPTGIVDDNTWNALGVAASAAVGDIPCSMQYGNPASIQSTPKPASIPPISPTKTYATTPPGTMRVTTAPGIRPATTTIITGPSGINWSTVGLIVAAVVGVVILTKD